MSTMEMILTNIREVVKQHPTFKNIEFYFDDAEMNPNTPLPAVSFKVGEEERTDNSPYCLNYVREIEIRLHTITLDLRLLQSELYDFEEDLKILMEDARLNGSFESFDIKQTKASGIGALVYQKNKGAGFEKENLFSNIIRVYFELTYQIDTEN